MQAAVANLKENVQSLTEALEKTEKLLLQRIQNRDAKIDEQEEMAQLILNEGIKRKMADAVDNVTENLQSSNEALDQELSISDDINRFLSAREKEAKDLLQRVNKTKDEHGELLERIKEKVRYAREEFGNDNDKLDYLTETVDKMAWFESVEKLYPQRVRDRKGIKMDEVEKEKVDKMAWFESVEKLYPQRARDRKGIKMDEVEKEEADKMAWFESVEKLYPQRARDRKGIKMDDEVEKEEADKMAWFESVEKLYRQRA